MRSGFFDSTEIVAQENGYPRGNKAESADFFAKFFSQLVGNGIFPVPSDAFRVTASDGLSVSVAPGAAYINGYFAFDDEAASLSLTSGMDAKLFRIVLRLDLTSGSITLALLEDAITLTRAGSVYELGLADIGVPAGAHSIAQSNITDLRTDSDICGIVCALIEQLDTSSFYAQLDSVIDEAEERRDLLDQFCNEAENDFNVWFDGLHDIMTDQAAYELEISKAERDLTNVASGAVLTAHLADNAVSTAKINASAVTGAKIAEGTVSRSHLDAELQSALERRIYDPYTLKLI